MRLAQIGLAAAEDNVAVNEALEDAQSAHEEALHVYNYWLNEYDEGRADYWWVEDSRLALDEAQLALSRAEQELVENFVHRLREQIEDARQQLAYLNTTLAALRFGGERFEFIAKPEPMASSWLKYSRGVRGDSVPPPRSDRLRSETRPEQDDLSRRSR